MENSARARMRIVNAQRIRNEIIWFREKSVIAPGSSGTNLEGFPVLPGPMGPFQPFLHFKFPLTGMTKLQMCVKLFHHFSLKVLFTRRYRERLTANRAFAFVKGSAGRFQNLQIRPWAYGDDATGELSLRFTRTLTGKPEVPH